MNLHLHPYTLELKHSFTLATSSRTTTPVVIVELEHDGITGYGEASMPPYLGESHESVLSFLSKLDLRKYDSPMMFEQILSDVDGVAQGNHAAKAALDIALHDWVGKKRELAWHRIWGLDSSATPLTSYTIGIDTKDVLRSKVLEAGEYRILKVKLGRENDKEIIEAIREVTDKPIRVDVNQGWRDRNEALKMIEWCAQQDVELVEQPMPKDCVDDHAWLKERSPIPIIADEAVARFKDIPDAVGAYDGINIKLMKCTGMNEAYRMMGEAKARGLKIMLGCMTETSCAISAAAQLSPLVDWADLDGAALIKNDPFEGAAILEGKITIPDGAGIGVRKIPGVL